MWNKRELSPAFSLPPSSLLFRPHRLGQPALSEPAPRSWDENQDVWMWMGCSDLNIFKHEKYPFIRPIYIEAFLKIWLKSLINLSLRTCIFLQHIKRGLNVTCRILCLVRLVYYYYWFSSYDCFPFIVLRGSFLYFSNKIIPRGEIEVCEAEVLN